MLHLRVDVDLPYLTFRKGMRKPNILTRAFYYPMNLLSLFFDHPGPEFLGYLKHLYDFIDYLEEKGVRATFFIRTNTIPRDQRLFRGHQVGVHSWLSDTVEDFGKEFHHVQRALSSFRIEGMSKHGSGLIKESWRHIKEYEPEKYLEWCKALGLRYLAGNLEDPRIPSKEVNGVMYYPSAFWLRRMRRPRGIDLKWLLDESETRDIIVLAHPRNWLLNIESERDDLEIILSRGSFALV